MQITSQSDTKSFHYWLTKVTKDQSHQAVNVYIRINLSIYFTKQLKDVIKILQKHSCQVQVSTVANGLNPICVTFEKYLLERPNHTCISWGHHYQALKELCEQYTVWVYGNNLEGFQLKKDMSVDHEWKVDDGGC